MAVAGFVCGLVGVFVAGVILGLLGIIFSAIALNRIGNNPDTKSGKGLAIVQYKNNNQITRLIFHRL